MKYFNMSTSRIFRSFFLGSNIRVTMVSLGLVFKLDFAPRHSFIFCHQSAYIDLSQLLTYCKCRPEWYTESSSAQETEAAYKQTSHKEQSAKGVSRVKTIEGLG
jgi:hypothetical protein